MNDFFFIFSSDGTQPQVDEEVVAQAQNVIDVAEKVCCLLRFAFCFWIPPKDD